MKNMRNISFYIILFVIILIIIAMWNDFNDTTFLKYSQFKNELNAGNVKSLQIQGLDAKVIFSKASGDLKENVIYKTSFLSTEHITRLVDEAMDKGLLNDVNYPQEARVPWWLNVLPTLVIVALLVLFWVFFIQQSQAAAETGSCPLEKAGPEWHQKTRSR